MPRRRADVVSVRIGVSLSSAHQSDDPKTAGRWLVERAQAADRVGLDSLSLGDHHAMPIPYYQNTPMLGRLLAEWGPRPAGCLFLLPLWNPVLVAEHVGTLAALTEGRFIVQTGIGQGRRQFRAMGADLTTRGAVLEENIDIVKTLIGGGEVMTDDGPVSLGLIPSQEVEWWIGGGPAPKAIDRAARIGDAWYAGPAEDTESARRQLDQYVEACRRHGTEPRPIARKDVIVLDSPRAATALGEQVLGDGYRGMNASQVAFGTPTEVAEKLRPMVAMGFNEIICRCMTIDQPQAIETIELLADVRALLQS